MQLDQITPLVLTYNEAANIRRMLERLTWARQIVIVDSFSTDETLEIVRQFPNTVIVQRTFDHFADQCNFGLQQIQTLWTLSLDADYLCPFDMPLELADINQECVAFRADFRYCIYGTPLRATLYPPRIVLYQTGLAKYVRDGHAHRVMISGACADLKSILDHDDHKPLSRWLKSQTAYAGLEAEKLLSADSAKLGWKDRIRSWIVLAPVLTVVYCLFCRMLILDGFAGLYYTLQRAYAELLLSLELLDRKLRAGQSSAGSRQLTENRKSGEIPGL